MNRRKVKITGIGPVTPAGVGRDGFWKGIQEPVSRVRPYTKLDPKFGSFVATWIDSFTIDRYFPRKDVPKGCARHTQFALAAAALAIEDSGIRRDELTRSNVAIVAGACVMDFEGILNAVENVREKGARGALGRTVYTTNGATLAASVANVLDLDAKTYSIQSSCCTGIDSIGYGARMIAEGEADIVICGGADAPLHSCPLIELRSVGMTPYTEENAHALDRPFDLWRTTGVVGEGACLVVLEAEKSPRPGYALVSGYGYSNDGGRQVCDGLFDAIKQASAAAGVRADQIDVINAWGPGHPTIDQGEARVLSRFFGCYLNRAAAVSIKGAIGNPLGAAGAIQVAATALGLSHGVVPPTVNWRRRDPDCGLNLSGEIRYVDHSVALVDAHGISGVNSSMVLMKCR